MLYGMAPTPRLAGRGRCGAILSGRGGWPVAGLIGARGGHSESAACSIQRQLAADSYSGGVQRCTKACAGIVADACFPDAGELHVNDYIVKEAHRLHQIELREKEHLKFLRLLLKDFMIKSGI